MLELCVGSQLLLLDNNSDAAQHLQCDYLFIFQKALLNNILSNYLNCPEKDF